MSQFRTAAVVDGACPFHPTGSGEPDTKKQRLETAAPASLEDATPATHFALAAGPASDSAVLLPFAQHRWHSRLVAALRDNARETHGGDLSTAAAFVLVALPEQARPKVFDLLVEVLELRREDPQSETGLPNDIPLCYVDLVNDVFPVSTHILNPEIVAALCQLCRLSEFIQLSIGVDLACSFIAPWVEHVNSSLFLPFVYRALEAECRAQFDPDKSPINVNAGDSCRRLTPDRGLLQKVQTLNFKRFLGFTPCGTIPQMFFDVLPPGVIPGPVLDSRLQCYTKTCRDVCLPVHCGAPHPENTAPCELYVTAATQPDPANGLCHATFGSGPSAIADWQRVCGNSAEPFLSVQLPGGLSAEDFPNLTFNRRTSHFIAPDDMKAEAFAAFVPLVRWATDIDLSLSKVTDVPELCFSEYTHLAIVHLPPTLEKIGDFAFPASVTSVTGVDVGVNVGTCALPQGCSVTY